MVKFALVWNFGGVNLDALISDIEMEGEIIETRKHFSTKISHESDLSMFERENFHKNLIFLCKYLHSVLQSSELFVTFSIIF